MDTWQEMARIPNAIPTRRDPMPTSAITTRAFDTSQDLLWSGDKTGRIASYYLGGHGMLRYTSFKAQGDAVVDILTNRAGVISASKDCVRLTNRRGVIKQNISDKELSGIASMTMASKSDAEIVLGGEGNLARVNVERGVVASSAEHKTGNVVKMTRGGANISAGLDNGKVEIIDPSSLEVVRSLNAHQGPVIDLDCQGSTLMTCGYSVRKTGYFPDPMVNVFDLRMMKSMAPVAFPAGAMYTRLHPKMTTYCIIAGSTGQVQILDYLRPTNVHIQQAAVTSAVTGMDLSATGDYLCLSDSEGFLQLWSNDPSGEATFTEFPTPMEFPTADDTVSMSFDEDASFSKVGMPYYKDELLSSWSDPNHVFDLGTAPPAVDPDITSRLAEDPTTGIRYAPNVKKVVRNVANPYVCLDNNNNRRSSVTVPKFKSEKERTGEVDDKTQLFEEQVKAGKIAKAYRKLEIKYSKFGIDDFDFDFYNSTKYSGLETQLSNSYCNALLQLFRFSPTFYNFAVQAVAKYNNTKPNLLHEFGLLFDMMYKADGKACKAGNFLKTLQHLPDARKFLYDDLMQSNNANTVGEGRMVQELAKFVMNQVSHESPDFLNLVAIPVTTAVKRSPCGVETQQNEAAFALDLVPQAQQQQQQQPHQQQQARAQAGFIAILRKSFERWYQSAAYCDMCQGYQNAGYMQTVTGLPNMLNVTIANDSNSRAMWENETSFPNRTFYATSARGKMLVRPDAKLGGTRYDLVGMICEIGNRGERDNHLVTIARTEDGWHLFNDFLVKKLDEQEAFDFTVKWKTPVMLLYQSNYNEVQFDYESWKQKMDMSLLYRDHFVQGEMAGYVREYKLLTQQEAPQPGQLVAIDAEFVKLQEEEVEIRSDGSKSMLMPKLLSLARVSVLRGQDPDEGTPFIDDYIATTDSVVDYLTSYSGIEDGDLDPTRSKKGLVTLQTSYKKLWLLLNLGCVFIGHGLHNDFRTINMQVPQRQVIDTLVLFSRPRQRNLSLKFLAWYLLDETVQSGNHDSIEDARTALLLYRKYKQLERDGTLEHTLDMLYDEGRKYGFKPPMLSRQASSTNLKAPSTPGA